MRPSKEESKQIIQKLVDRFSKNIETYTKNSYKEAEVKAEFIEPFFAALGWDMDNALGRKDSLKEVVREANQKSKGTIIHPDYAFNYGGHVVFYVETKQPSKNIHDDINAVYQLKNYAWNKKLAMSVLTDFQELSIYEIKKQPKKTDSTNSGRKYYTYDQYIDNFDFIWNILSWEAVYNLGTYQTYVDGLSKKGTEEIDNVLLDSVSKWRLNLVNGVKLENLDAKSLNIAVQKIIDRILFLRIAEDKQIEPQKQLLSIISSDSIYKSLILLFDKANTKYNSGLFKKETWIDKLEINNKILKNIILEMYPEGDCPYKWSILPIDILGNIYEQFLGSEIVIKNSKPKIQQKEEVKKAGGVYYTPKYIVDFIVEETLGKKLENATLTQADKLKIVDPSCGSGSFLIGAYKYLLDWYLNKYCENEKKYLKKQKNEKYAKLVYITLENKKEPIISLSIEEKQRILLDHIYGVDIDDQAVEVSKLSLFLQMLDKQGKLSDKYGSDNLFMASEGTILPNLSNNIVCGNSLIDTNFYKTELYDDNRDLIDKIKPFDWEKSFVNVFLNGGFDIVIGNPPYVSSDNQSELNHLAVQREYLTRCNKYESLYKRWDLFVPFIEKSIKILKPKGIYSQIVKYELLNQNYCQKIRELLLDKYNLIKLIDCKGTKIFRLATVTNCIPIVTNEKFGNNVNIIKLKEGYMFIDLSNKSKESLVANNKNSIWDVTTNYKDNRYSNLNVLGDFCYISYGMRLVNKDNAKEKFIKEDLISTRKDKIHCREYIENKDFSKYYLSQIRYIEYNTKRCPENVYRPIFREWFNIPKIFCSRLGDLQAYIDFDNYYIHDDSIIGVSLWWYLRDVKNRSITKSIKQSSKLCREQMEELSHKVTLKYLIALLNSKYISYYIDSIRGGDYHIYPEQIRDIPIPIPKENDIKNVESLVDKMLVEVKDLHNAPEYEKQKYQKVVDLLNDKIDEIVYRLYGLSQGEIAEIENHATFVRKTKDV